jgi:hypothetical protein
MRGALWLCAGVSVALMAALSSSWAVPSVPVRKWSAVDTVQTVRLLRAGRGMSTDDAARLIVELYAGRGWGARFHPTLPAEEAAAVDQGIRLLVGELTPKGAEQ